MPLPGYIGHPLTLETNPNQLEAIANCFKAYNLLSLQNVIDH